MKKLVTAAAAGLTLAAASAATAGYVRYTVSGVDTGGVVTVADPIHFGVYNISVKSSGGTGYIEAYGGGLERIVAFYPDGSVDYNDSNDVGFQYSVDYAFPAAPKHVLQVVNSPYIPDLLYYYPDGTTLQEALFFDLGYAYVDVYGGSDAANGGFVPLGNYTITISSVPEPADWSLMLLGLGALGIVLRRRSSSHVRLRRMGSRSLLRQTYLDVTLYRPLTTHLYGLKTGNQKSRLCCLDGATD